MKFRHKVTTMVSAAAVLVVIVAVAALAAGGLGFGTPKQDIVLDQPIAALPEPAPDVKDTIVYTHKKGIYYHAQSSCSGMKNAPETTLAQAEADGKTACPVCIRIDTAAAATPTPIPVHSTPEPTLPVTATLTPRPTPQPTPQPTAQNEEWSSYSIGIIGGADGPTSIFISQPTAEPEVFAYTAENTGYYHLEEDCPAAQDAARTTVEAAQARGKQPCPFCAPSPMATLIPADPEEEQRQAHWLDGMLQVYATENGKFYHAIPDCSGMQNAYILLSKDGDAEGKQPCPNCIPDIGDSSFRRFFGTGIDEAFPGFTRTVATLGTYSDRHGAYLNYSAHMRLENADGDFIVIQLTPPAYGLDGELELSAADGIVLQTLLDHSYEPFGDLTNELIPLYLQRRTGSAKSCPVSSISVSFDGDADVTGCSTVLDIDEETCYLVHWPMKDGRFVLPEIEPTPMPEERVFASERGVYYHSDSSCAGMRDAVEMLRREAMQSGKQACPLCMGNSAQPTPAPVVQEDERVLSTIAPMSADSAVPGENPTFTPLNEAFSTILGLDFEDAFPGCILDYAEGHPIEEGSGNAAYNMWQFSDNGRTLIVSLLDAVEKRDGVISINFPDNASSFRMMKQVKEPLRSLYMKIAPELADGLRTLTGGDASGSRYLWDAYIHFNTRMEITVVELVYAFSDASTAHFSWNTAEGEPRMYSMNWIG